MDTGGAGLQADTVPPSLLHDLRFLQLQFVDSRHHDAIARFPDIPQRPGHLVIFRLDAGQLCQQAHEVTVIPHIKAGLLRERPVEHLPGQAHPCGGYAGAKVDGCDERLADVLVFSQFLHCAVDLPDVVQLRHALPDGVIDSRLYRMLSRQSVHPRR